MAHFEQQNQESAIDLSDTDFESDDSQDDPTFDIVGEIGSGLSKLSINRKSKPRVSHQMDEDIEDDSHVVVPKLSEKEQISYDNIIQMIEAGNLEKLKVDQCKVYLRKHGLRVTDTKEKLMNRIREHLEIRNGEGETKYPASSFVFNCKGDACTGDVVLFEQNVYEMFSIASRSATGPPCRTRVVAGRIVKESYGTAKQQHTFTVEVLWSKGEKPHPPLHPLLIKGRNLYRIKTMRQKWEDEGKRQNLLAEKHARGFVARSNRDARVNERDMRKKKMKANSGMMPTSKINKSQNPSQAEACPKVDGCSETLHSKRQPLSTMSCNVSGAQSGIQIPQHHHMFKQPVSSDQPDNRFGNRSSSISQRWDKNDVINKNPASLNFHRYANQESLNVEATNGSLLGSYRSSNHNTSISQRLDQNEIRSKHPASSHFPRHDNPASSHFPRHDDPASSHFQRHVNPASSVLGPYRGSNHQTQVCRYYNQGRCHFGDNCKYLHVSQ